MPRPFIIPVFIPHLGCPHRCVFCDQQAIAGASVKTPSPSEVAETVGLFLNYKGRRRGDVEVAFYGGNFLGLSDDYRDSLLEAVHPFIRQGRVAGIRFSTRPDSVTMENVSSLKSQGVRAVEIGAQSMDDRVLERSRRGHSAQGTVHAVQVVHGAGLAVGIQIMPGLPGDTHDSTMASGYTVAALRPDFVRIYPAVVVKGTALEKWFLAGTYSPLTLDEAVAWTKGLYDLFRRRGIPVIRMGLHPSEGLQAAGTVVAGPFHPAFGHLVHSALFYDMAVEALSGQAAPAGGVTLRVHPRDLSRMQGQNKENLKRLQDRFLLQVAVVSDGTVPPGTVATRP